MDFPLAVLLVKATLILLVALGLTVAMQRAPAGARHLVWLVTLGALLFVPALTAWGPLRLAILPAVEQPSAADVSRSAVGGPATAPAPISGLIAPSEATPGASAPTANALAAEASSASAALEALGSFASLFTAWIAVSLAILLWLAWGAFEVRRIVRGAQPLRSPDWTRPLFEIADRLELENPPRLLRSDDARMPFACGFLTPTIVLPRDCEGWTLDRRRAVLLHELAHVKRRDLAGHTLGRIACALYWFHPLAWTAAKRLRAESERACDDMAIACGARASDYAEHLLEIVTSVRHDRTPAVALAMARRKEFEGRMLAILDREPGTVMTTRRQSATLIAALGFVAVLIGAASPAPRTAPAVQTLADTTASSNVGADTAATVSVPATRVAARQAETPRTAAPSRESTAPAPAPLSGTAPVARIEAPSAPSSLDAASLTALVQRAQSGTQKGADERPALLADVLAKDTSAVLRRIAAWGLHEYVDDGGDRVAARALATALRGDASARVREMAAWALHDAEDGGSVVIEALSQAVRSDADASVRSSAAWSLGNIGDDGAEPALVEALADSSRDVRVRAIWALGNIGPRQAPAQLVARLRDSSASVRKLTAWALYQIEDPATAPALDAALRAETDKNLQMAYIRALAAIGEESVDAIRTLLQSSDPQVRSMAVRALAGGSATGPWPMPWPEPRPHP